jgi:hypothetical protein
MKGQADVVYMSNARIILRKTTSPTGGPTGQGWKILTGYPQP